MLHDPDLRSIQDATTGDFLVFELFDAGVWRAFRVTDTAFAVLEGGGGFTRLSAFEKHIERIKGVAFAQHKVGNGYTVLDSSYFE